MMKWIKNKIHSLVWNWDMMNVVAGLAAERAEKKLYSDLSNRISLDQLIEALEKVRKDNPSEKYIAVAEIIVIQSKKISKEKNVVE